MTPNAMWCASVCCDGGASVWHCCGRVVGNEGNGCVVAGDWCELTTRGTVDSLEM